MTEEETVESKLRGKTVLITEATRNFGRDLALAFAQEGANLALASRDNHDQLERICQEASGLGVKVSTFTCDLSNESQVENLVSRCVAEQGSLDVVINNVLFPLPLQSLEDLPFELWKRKIEVETTGSFLLFKQVIPQMIQQRWGRVVNFTGLDAFNGADVMSSATEMGLIGLTRGIAREYGKHNITANCIGPGGIENEEAQGLHPVAPQGRDAIPRWGTPEEVTFLAVTLCSEGASYITGQCLLANGGKHFL
jgi:NAD(P)-dependent dehydrogenase (short-subunit alcohol dehydrogenase family)